MRIPRGISPGFHRESQRVCLGQKKSPEPNVGRPLGLMKFPGSVIRPSLLLGVRANSPASQPTVLVLGRA